MNTDTNSSENKKVCIAVAPKTNKTGSLVPGQQQTKRK